MNNRNDVGVKVMTLNGLGMLLFALEIYQKINKYDKIMNTEAMEKELIELRIKLMNADRFIKVHNDPMAAQQVIGNCMQQVNNLLERKSDGKPVVDTEANAILPVVTISLPSDEKILEKAKEVIPEDLYKDCGGYVTIEDRNERKRNILIQGIKLGLKGNEW